MSSLSTTLLSIQQVTVEIMSWIYIIFGITGCLLNILLFSQKQFRSISCCTCKSILLKTKSMSDSFFSWQIF